MCDAVWLTIPVESSLDEVKAKQIGSGGTEGAIIVLMIGHMLIPNCTRWVANVSKNDFTQNIK